MHPSIISLNNSKYMVLNNNVYVITLNKIKGMSKLEIRKNGEKLQAESWQVEVSQNIQDGFEMIVECFEMEKDEIVGALNLCIQEKMQTQA